MTFSNVVIKGNNIQSGTSSTPTTYTYDTIISNGADALISNNYLSGITSNASTSIFLDLSSCNCQVLGNKFFRGSADGYAYVRNTGITNNHIITNNYFDGYTINGTNENLVVGLNATSIYEKNVNQTMIKLVPISAVEFSYEVNSTPTAFTAFNIIGAQFSLTGTDVGIIRTNLALDLSKYIPQMARVITVVAGMASPSGGGAASNILVSVTLTQQVDNNLDLSSIPSTLSGTVLDVISSVDSINDTTSTFDLLFVADLQLDTQFTTVDTSSKYYIINSHNPIYLTYVNTIEMSSGTLTFRISSIAVKYRW